MQKVNANILKEENGNVLLLFSLTVVILIGIVGFAIDLSMIYMERNDLINMSQVLRNDRFTFQDEIRYSDNPGLTCYQLVEKTLTDNAFEGDIRVYFEEVTLPGNSYPEDNYREYNIRTVLSKEYNYHFLCLFGYEKTNIIFSLDGGQAFGEGLNDVIWHPSKTVAEYNGLYFKDVTGAYSFVVGEKPSDW
ncbi:MAG: pilus assembly protein TadG-related protein [Coprobacillaceae bacterium]